MLNPIQALGMPNQKVAAWHKAGGKTIYDVLLRLLIEVNHNVAAENNLEWTKRGTVIKQIEMLKIDQCFDFTLHEALVRKFSCPFEDAVFTYLRVKSLKARRGI